MFVSIKEIIRHDVLIGTSNYYEKWSVSQINIFLSTVLVIGVKLIDDTQLLAETK